MKGKKKYTALEALQKEARRLKREANRVPIPNILKGIGSKVLTATEATILFESANRYANFEMRLANIERRVRELARAICQGR